MINFTLAPPSGTLEEINRFFHQSCSVAKLGRTL